MPQVFQVLKCFKCTTFQVHQTKKSNKFQCKMCGEKQSIKRHYGLGNGQECRKHVQKLNGIKGDLDESRYDNINLCSDDENDETDLTEPIVRDIQQKIHSKWSDFVETEEITGEANSTDEMYLNDVEVVLELPSKRQKTMGCYGKNCRYMKKCVSNNDSEKVNEENKESQIINTLENSNAYKHCRKPVSPVNPIVNKDYDNSNFAPECKEREKNALVDKITTRSNSKWSKFEPEVGQSSTFKDILDRPKYLAKRSKNCILPTLNKNSKWSKFTEEGEEESKINLSDESKQNEVHGNEDTGMDSDEFTSGEKSQVFFCKSSSVENIQIHHLNTTSNHSKLNYHTLFTLCDDNELDEFLKI